MTDTPRTFPPIAADLFTTDRRQQAMTLEALRRRILPGNPKLHDVDAIALAILRWGWTIPCALDATSGHLVAGHGRLEALEILCAGGTARASELMRLEGDAEAVYDGAWPPRGLSVDPAGAWLVPVLVIPFENEDERDAYVVADNQLGPRGGWDEDALRSMLARFGSRNLRSMGFDADEYNRLMSGFRVRLQNEKELPAPPPARTQLGDVWKLGDHRLMCGDSTSQELVRALLGGELARCCFTDPPYNVEVVSGHREISKPERKKRAAHAGGEFATIAGDAMGENFAPFLAQSIRTIYHSLVPGAPLWMFMSWREWSTMDLALRADGWFHWSSTIVYAKDSFTLSNCDFHPQTEGCWYGWRADAPRICPVEARDIGDLWNFSRPTVGQQGERHPTEKPVGLVTRALRHTTRRGDMVLDPFGGGGSTLIAAEATGRRAVLIEIEPRWCDYIVQKWEQATGGTATRSA